MHTNHRRNRSVSRDDRRPRHFGDFGSVRDFKHDSRRAERRRPMPDEDGEPRDLHHKLPDWWAYD